VTGVFTKSGTEAHFTTAGKVSSIRTATGATITGSGAQRQVVSQGTMKSGTSYKAISTSANSGYVERKLERGQGNLVQRTYVTNVNNVTVTNVRVYQTYSYRSVVYYTYVPPVYYGPAFYGWVYDPWGAPVPYAWGWAGSPWYGWYGYYWTPYPVYPSAAYWMTDYIIAQNLQAAYNAGAASAGGGSQGSTDQQAQTNSAAMSPEVKEMIAQEVKAQLAAEQAAAQNSNATPSTAPANSEQAPPALDSNRRFFIVFTRLDVTADGQACSLNAGDVIKRKETAPNKDNTVAVEVVTSQKSSCNSDSVARVRVADLQEMHNHFREQMDSGLKVLAEKQGQDGIPNSPSSDSRKNPEGTAVADLSASGILKQQQQDADQAEKEVRQAAPSSSGGND